MPFDYSVLQLESLAALPVKPDWPEKEKDEALKNMLLDMVNEGKIKKITCGEKVFKLVDRTSDE